MSTFEEQQLERMVFATRLSVLERFNPDTCILTARCLIDVLKYHGGLESTPQAVEVLAFNGAYVKRMEQEGRMPQTRAEFEQWEQECGAYSIGIISDQKQRPNGWRGHVILVVQGKENEWFIDPSSDSLSRPLQCLPMGPIIYRLQPGRHGKFAAHKGIEWVLNRHDGCRQVYISLGKQNDYQQSPDWCEPTRRQQIVEEVLLKLQSMEQVE